MVEADVGYDGAGGARYGVRGVKPPAEARLEHGDIAALAREVIERQRGAELELGALFAHALRRGGERGAAPGEVRVGYIAAVYARALVHAREVGRDVEPGFISRRRQDAPEQGRGAALAVRARDVDEAHALLRAAQPLEQLRYSLQPGARAQPGHALYIFKRLRIVQGEHLPWGIITRSHQKAKGAQGPNLRFFGPNSQPRPAPFPV